MKEDALPLWDEIVPRLANLVSLGAVDSIGLADLVLCVYRLRECEADLDMNGLVVDGHRGVRAKNPATALARQYREAIQKWFSTFGLTPAARKGLAEPKQETKSPLELAREKLNSAATATVQ